MGAPHVHNLEFDPQPASDPGGHDFASERRRYDYPAIGVYLLDADRLDVGQGTGTAPRSAAEDSRPPL